MPHNLGESQSQPTSRQYQTRATISSQNRADMDKQTITPPTNGALITSQPDTPVVQQSPGSPTPKSVAFELLIDEGQHHRRGRLPLRVKIFPHDTTDSIIATVKNFYGLYNLEGTAGVSFEDEQGNTLIARYENFRNGMTVSVRVIPDYPYAPPAYQPPSYNSASPVRVHESPSLGEPFQMMSHEAQYNQSRPTSRQTSRVSHNRSISPGSHRGVRSTSRKSRSRSVMKTRGAGSNDGAVDTASEAMDGYSSDEGTVTSSRKARSEQLASAEISLDNIVTESRRKKAKFESSELPLFQPPQVPVTASTSSISPQRRSIGQDAISPFAPPQRIFLNQPNPSPRFSYGDQTYTVPLQKPGSAGPVHHHQLRDRTNTSYNVTRAGPLIRNNGPGVLPTPDPTIASCISDEDVALQLMRLGDASNISHGRTSTSTMDDAYSGKADVASSTGATSENDGDVEDQETYTLPPHSARPKNKVKSTRKNAEDNAPGSDDTDPSVDDPDGDEDYIDKGDANIKSEADEYVDKPKPVKSRAKSRGSSTKTRVNTKISKSRSHSKKTKTPAPSTGEFKLPASPSSLPPHSRKPSTASTYSFQHQLGQDEEDLSTKPRCQRCRKSKKGCDRQRPCQRCKDAGIGIEGCISEDESNGRKGRYGRHMGISVKRKADSISEVADTHAASAILTGMAGGAAAGEKAVKKRKK
ncbi:MAG: hypothetical protein M1834_001067 [Cirrosporium novae-zelandiae]|nr:MAG: hypothetical protein M1834_001067 [Cirrosporium novae-zelandiae]